MAKFHKANEEFQVNSSYIGVEVDPGKYPTGWKGNLNIRCFNKSDSIFIKGHKYIYICTGETIKYDGDTFWQFRGIDEGSVYVWFVDNNAKSPNELAMTVGDDLYYLQIVDGEVISDRVQEQISSTNLMIPSCGVFITSSQGYLKDEGVGTIEATNPRYGIPGIYKFSVNGNLIGLFDYTKDVSFDVDITGDPKYDPENPKFVYWPVPGDKEIPCESFENPILLTDAFESVISIKKYNSGDYLYPQVGAPFYIGTSPLSSPARQNKVRQIYEEENPVNCEVKLSVTRERWLSFLTIEATYCAAFEVPRYMFLRFSQDVWITEE